MFRTCPLRLCGQRPRLGLPAVFSKCTLDTKQHRPASQQGWA